MLGDLENELRENRRKSLLSAAFIEQISTKIIIAFAKRQMDYTYETQFGKNMELQKRCELQIQKELAELAAYEYQK